MQVGADARFTYTSIEEMKPGLGIEHFLRMTKRRSIFFAKRLLQTDGIGNSTNNLCMQGDDDREEIMADKDFFIK